MTREISNSFNPKYSCKKCIAIEYMQKKFKSWIYLTFTYEEENMFYCSSGSYGLNNVLTPQFR